MFDLGIEVVLLSGDHRATVEALAKSLDVATVRAELVPEDRGAEVQRLRETGGKVAAVGFPVTDDGLLAASDVAIVLGAAGDAAVEREVTLSTEDVRDAAAALFIAQAAHVTTTRALLAAIAVGIAAVGTAALGLTAPAVAALAHAAVDAYALPSGARLLRRIDLRVPARS
jgi:Cu+-exporting ATPase